MHSRRALLCIHFYGLESDFLLRGSEGRVRGNAGDREEVGTEAAATAAAAARRAVARYKLNF